MRRRDFMKLSAGFAPAAAALAPLSPAPAQTKMVFKASDVQPAGYPTVVATENLGKKLEAATNGRLSVPMFPSMQLADAVGQAPASRRSACRSESRSAWSQAE